MDALIVQGEISSRILTLRGEQVMLDRGLAELYGVRPIRLREQVKRNSERFPRDFMFQLYGIAKCDTFQTTPWRCIAVCIHRAGPFDKLRDRGVIWHTHIY